MSDGAGITPLDSVDEVDFFDPATNDCPYHAYKTLRDEAPVWQDPRTGMWTLTRHDDVKMAARDVETFSSVKPRGKRDPNSELVLQMYQDKGWVPGRTLAGRNDPEHKEMRALFSHAFRQSRITALEPQIVEIADDLMADCLATAADAGQCDWVEKMAVPLPLLIIGIQMGADPDDIWKIKAWTDAWVQRLGMMQTHDEVVWSTEMEIEAQHYFQPIFERLRVEPDDTLLSDLVNTVIPEWGRTLTDEELHAEMMADTFVGGSETTTNAISQGMKLLIENPKQWDILKSDPDRYLPVLAEEAIRLEGPVQTLFRFTTRDVEVSGTVIPANSMVALRWGSANRDDGVFEHPDAFDLERADYKQHVGFGFGTHFCLGAPLARREIIHAFRALVKRVDSVAFVDGANDFKIAPNYVLRALEELHVTFTPSA